MFTREGKTEKTGRLNEREQTVISFEVKLGHNMLLERQERKK